MNLYEISTEYRQVFDAISEMEGITDEILRDTISPIASEFNKKAVNITSYFKNLDAEAKAIKEAESMMSNRRKSIERKIESLKNYLKENMILSNISKIECPYFKILLSKSKNSVQVIDESLIPEELMRVKTTKEPDKDLILKKGGCKGVEIKEGYSLRIS